MNHRQRMSCFAVGVALCLFLAVVGRVVADDAGPATKRADPSKADRDALQGKWRLAGVDGRPSDKMLRFDGDEVYAVEGDDKKDPAVFRLDATKAPKQIDLIPQDGPEKGATLLAIYDQAGDTLRLAIGRKDNRPTTFEQVEGVVVLTFKKVKD